MCMIPVLVWFTYKYKEVKVGVFPEKVNFFCFCANYEYLTSSDYKWEREMWLSAMTTYSNIYCTCSVANEPDYIAGLGTITP